VTMSVVVLMNEVVPTNVALVATIMMAMDGTIDETKERKPQNPGEKNDLLLLLCYYCALSLFCLKTCCSESSIDFSSRSGLYGLLHFFRFYIPVPDGQWVSYG